MTEETSLFDRGMDKLDSVFKGMEIPSIGNFLTTVTYNWDEDKIIISSTISPTSRDAKNQSEAREWCLKTVENMKLILGVNGSIGDSLHEYSYINQYFSHYGYKNNMKSRSQGKDLDWITRLRATIHYADKGKIDSYASCEGKLYDKEVRFIK